MAGQRRRGWRGWRVSGVELRVAILAGLLGGLIHAQLPMRPLYPDAPTRREARPEHPWRESERSKVILEAQEGAPVPRADSGEISSARVQPAMVQVIDGDTFRHGGETIRIADIDTPEVRGRCPYESALAARATVRMTALLRAGPFELHAIDRDEDRYGRKLRIVTRDGRSLGDQLVGEGLARTWTGRREPWC